LPRPDEKIRKKRGGRKFRNMRLKYQMTMARKMQNIVPFGSEAQKEFRETGHSMGMHGISGKLRVGIQKDQKILKKKPMQRTFGGGSGATNGMASSLVMTAN
jgi:U4/U6 small nuclear ribonucleoprotein PRP31